MSCHFFLHAVRYGNIIIGVYTGGSGSTEPFCVRLARRARAGLDEKHQHPVPLSGPWAWLGLSCWAGCPGGKTEGIQRWLGQSTFGQKLLLFRISGIIYLMHYFSSVWVLFSFCKGTTEEVCRCVRLHRCCFKPNLPEHKGVTTVLKIFVRRVFHVQTVTNFNAEKPQPERKPFYSRHVKEYK